MTRRTVIIGGVAGGMSAAARLARLDPEMEIVVLEKSGHVSYANCGLPYYAGGVIKDESALLLATPESLGARFGLDVRVNSEATDIDAAGQRVLVRDRTLEAEYELSYDYLILSPGAAPVVPPIPGIERALLLRNIEDVEVLERAIVRAPEHAVVIGGGFIGLEMAENLVHRGIAVSLVEATSQLLAPLDPEMASLVADEMALRGVSVHLGVSVTSITATTVELSTGEEFEAGLVVAAIGVRAETKLAQSAGLALGPTGAVVVDEFNRTSDHRIYALGDATEKYDSVDGSATLVALANVANRHGRRVADHIAGLRVKAVPTIGVAIVKVFSLAVATCGWNEKRLMAKQRPYVAIHTHPASHAGYYPGAEALSMKLLLEPGTGRILGAQIVGSEGVDKRIDVIVTAMRAGITGAGLADLELAYAPPFGSAKDPINMLGYVAQNRLSGQERAIQWSDVAAYQSRGFRLVDVRGDKEFAAGSIPGAINIPVDELRQRLSEIPAGPVVVYCQVGVRGHVAGALLVGRGREVVNLDGGYETWVASPAGRSVSQLLVTT